MPYGLKNTGKQGFKLCFYTFKRWK